MNLVPCLIVKTPCTRVLSPWTYLWNTYTNGLSFYICFETPCKN